VKSDFLGMMSHELRTPLNAIGGYAELLEEQIYGPMNEEQRAALARIRRAQRYLLSLVNNVLSSLKLGSGQMRFHVTDVTLDRIIATVEEMTGPQMIAKRIDFTVVRPDCDMQVRADEEKVQQILLNLVTNAIKFTAPGGRIRIDCEIGAESVRTHVVDTGCGIPPDRLASVFEPFVQVQDPASRGGEGTGLGLAISRDLATGMGGRLDAESEVGKGSTFTLTLPRLA
jgi:signal transduction histidine kinase